MALPSLEDEHLPVLGVVPQVEGVEDKAVAIGGGRRGELVDMTRAVELAGAEAAKVPASVTSVRAFLAACLQQRLNPQMVREILDRRFGDGTSQWPMVRNQLFGDGRGGDYTQLTEAGARILGCPYEEVPEGGVSVGGVVFGAEERRVRHDEDDVIN